MYVQLARLLEMVCVGVVLVGLLRAFWVGMLLAELLADGCTDRLFPVLLRCGWCGTISLELLQFCSIIAPKVQQLNSVGFLITGIQGASGHRLIFTGPLASGFI